MQNGSEEDALNKKLNGTRFERGRIFLTSAKGKLDQANQIVKSKKKSNQDSARVAIPLAYSIGFSNTVCDIHNTPKPIDAIAPKLITKLSQTNRLSCSIMVGTVNQESVDNVLMIDEGLGCRDINVKGISSRKFLISFAREEDFVNLDKEFFSIGFTEIKDLVLKELTVSRRTWVKCRCLPVPSWNLVNLQEILKKWGSIVQCMEFVDIKDFYKTLMC